MSVLGTPVFGVAALTWPTGATRRGPVRLALMGTRTLFQLYVWVGWAAYCASLVLRYTSHQREAERWHLVAARQDHRDSQAALCERVSRG